MHIFFNRYNLIITLSVAIFISIIFDTFMNNRAIAATCTPNQERIESSERRVYNSAVVFSQGEATFYDGANVGISARNVFASQNYKKYFNYRVTAANCTETIRYNVPDNATYEAQVQVEIEIDSYSVPFKHIYKFQAGGYDGYSNTMTWTNFIPSRLTFNYTKENYYDYVGPNGSGAASSFGASCTKHFVDGETRVCGNEVSISYTRVENTLAYDKYLIYGTHTRHRVPQDNIYAFAMKSKSVKIVPTSEITHTEGGIEYHGVYNDSFRMGVYTKEQFTCWIDYNGTLADVDCTLGMRTAEHGQYTMYLNTGAGTSNTKTNGAATNAVFKGIYKIDNNVNNIFVPNTGMGTRNVQYYYKHTSGGTIVDYTAYQRVYYPTKIVVDGDKETSMSQLGLYNSLYEVDNLQSSNGEIVTCEKTYGTSPNKQERSCIPASSVSIAMKKDIEEAYYNYPAGILTGNGAPTLHTIGQFSHHFGYDYNEKPMYFNIARPAQSTGVYDKFKEKDPIRRSHFIFKENGVSDDHSLDYYYIVDIEITPKLTTEDDFIAVNETNMGAAPIGIHALKIKNLDLSGLKINRYEFTDRYDTPECKAIFAENKFSPIDCTQLLEVWYNFPYDERGHDDLTKRTAREKDEYYFYKDNSQEISNSGIFIQGDTVRYQRYAFQDNGHNEEFFLKFAYAAKVDGNLSKPLTYSDSDWGEYRCTVHYANELTLHPNEILHNVERVIDNKTRDCWYRLYHNPFEEAFPINGDSQAIEDWKAKEKLVLTDTSDPTYNNATDVRNINFNYINNTHVLKLEQTRIYADKVEVVNYVPENEITNTNQTHPSNTGKTGSKYEYYCFVYWGATPKPITTAKGQNLDDEAAYIKNYNDAIRTPVTDISHLDGVWHSSPVGTHDRDVSYIGSEWLLTGYETRDGMIVYPDKSNELYIIDNVGKKHKITCTYQNYTMEKEATELVLTPAQNSDYDSETINLIHSKLNQDNLEISDVEIITDTDRPIIGNEPNSNGERFQKPLANKTYEGSTRSDNQILAVMHNSLRSDVYFQTAVSRFYDKPRPKVDEIEYNLIGLEHMYLIDVTYANVARDTFKNYQTEIDTFVQDNAENPFAKVKSYSTNEVTKKVVTTTSGTRVDVNEETIHTKNNNNGNIHKGDIATEPSFYISTDASNYDFEKSFDGNTSSNLGMYEDMAMVDMNYQTNHWYDFQTCILWSDKKGDSGTATWNGKYFENSTYICYKGGEEDINQGLWSYSSEFGQDSFKIELHPSETRVFKDGKPYNSYLDALAYNTELLTNSGLSNTNIPFNAMDHRVPNNGWNNIRFDLYSEYELRVPHLNNPDTNRNYVANNYWSRQPEGILILQDNLVDETVVRSLRDSSVNTLEQAFSLIKKNVENVTSDYGKTQLHQAWLIWDDGNYVKNNGDQKIKDIIIKADGTRIAGQHMNPWKNSGWLNINTLPNTTWEVKELSKPLEVSEIDGLKLVYNEFEAYESYRTIAVSWGDDYRIFESNNTNPYWDFVQQSIIVKLGDKPHTDNPAEDNPNGCNVDIPRQGCPINKDSIYLPSKADIDTEKNRVNDVEIKIDVTGVSKGTGY